MAPMQKRAWWGLATGLVFGIAFILVFFLMGGIETFDEDVNFRLTIDALMLAALIGNLVIVNLPLLKPAMVDERDRRIIDTAPRVQWLAIIFTLVAWTIGLTEHYHDTGLVPSVYLFIVFMSVLIVSSITQSLGIIIGYWRMDRYG
jgi:hypothetical protein